MAEEATTSTNNKPLTKTTNNKSQIIINENDLQLIREKTSQILSSLLLSTANNNDHDSTDRRTIDDSNKNDDKHLYYYHDSWIRGKTKTNILYDAANEEEYPSPRCKYFDRNGFLLIKSFCDITTEVNLMKEQMQTLVNEMWDPNNEEKKVTVFRTDDKQIDNQGSDDYFLESANKVHFFAESKAMEEDGKLKREFLKDKMLALNKAGHGMHMIPGEFHNYTTSDKIKDLVKELGWSDPIVPQSMYIFKQARVGGEVTSHQDSTFLYTTPKQSCLGLWLALDNATLENGCLWVRPGSHREKVRRAFGRNPEHFGDEVIKCRSNIAKGDVTKSQMIFTNEPESKPIPWEGKIPGQDTGSVTNENSSWQHLFEAGFVPVECNAGDLVVFPGELDHLSLPNYSDKQRHTFQLHLVEGEKAGVKWSEKNWLQYPKGIPFLRISSI